MAEKEFEKTISLTPSEVEKILSVEFGPRLKLQDVKPNHHIVMKILEPVIISEYEWGEEKDTAGNVIPGRKQTYRLKCHYKPSGYEGFDLIIQIGENAIKRLQEKYPNDSYVGKYAFFSRTTYQGTFPQFIHPMDNYNEPKSKEELFAKKEKIKKQDSKKQGLKPDLNDFTEKFVPKYLEKLKSSKIKVKVHFDGKDNEVEVPQPPNAIHLLGAFLANTEKERLKELIEKCKETVK